MSKRSGGVPRKKLIIGDGRKGSPGVWEIYRGFDVKIIGIGSKRSLNVWLSLPKSVVQSRAGLIPSDETDATPPPDVVTARELRRWRRGLPVLVKPK